jgi:hypothetical protein
VGEETTAGRLSVQRLSGPDKLVQLQAWVLLGGFFLVHNLTHVAYEALELEFPARQQFLFTFSLAPFLWYWLAQECRARGQSFPFDMGLFLLLAWWALLPYYLWKSQRWRGLGKVALLGLVWAATYFFSRVFSWILWW